MKFRLSILIVGFILFIGIKNTFLKAPEKDNLPGYLIFTQVSTDGIAVDFEPTCLLTLNANYSLASIDLRNPEESLTILTEDFFSARTPVVSYDGQKLLFMGKWKEKDPWQIWELDLGNLKTRRVTSGTTDCAEPAYLPDSRIIYSKLIEDDPLGADFALFTCNPDGSQEKRVTFHPHSDFVSAVLKDGRVLMTSRQLFPSEGDIMVLAMRPDGTKAELFYKGQVGNGISSRSWETEDGKVVFVESGEKDQVVAISLNRPLHSRVSLTDGIEGSFQSVVPFVSGRLIVSCRTPGAGRYALYEFDAQGKKLGRLIHANPEFDLLEPVLVTERPRPKILPSQVNELKPSGLFLCLNSNKSDIPLDDINTSSKAQRVQVLGLSQTYAEVPIEEDGSFYIQVIADTPLRFQMVSETGQVLRGPSAWIWVRPNERRGCVGCHANPELAPENLVPMSVNKLPVTLHRSF